MCNFQSAAMTTLLADVARCDGALEMTARAFVNEWVPECQDCQRRTDRSTFPLPVWMAPPPFEGGKCGMRIASTGTPRQCP